MTPSYRVSKGRLPAGVAEFSAIPFKKRPLVLRRWCRYAAHAMPQTGEYPAANRPLTLHIYKLRSASVEYVSEPVSEKEPVFAAETVDRGVIIGNLSAVAPHLHEARALNFIGKTASGFVVGEVGPSLWSIEKLLNLSGHELIKSIADATGRVSMPSGSYDLLISNVVLPRSSEALSWVLIREAPGAVEPSSLARESRSYSEARAHSLDKEEERMTVSSRSAAARALWRASAQSAAIAIATCVPLTFGVMEWRPLGVIILVVSGILAVYYARRSTENPDTGEV